ncbi:hypothetical protein PV325_008294 [Microctonus aethiopoides]|uniref:t-SNARE coiled-coil homology domain-containing protein n=1 Tax=Microctonus aethiopoides TaxID=144406 RepID=A0AA39C9P4_9HYME|nr:hypothetical protein PV325_008294 [Microctonus aethiopoides]KAK0091983.1 hypothetical protein PV326_002424 [Microctonus aethiopoides]KAK0160070.1 hypothetical protein PV328_007515 [Microctonus aethiopoides]
MSQDYLYACQRAELLGQPAPTEEEWAETQKNINEHTDQEDVDEAVAQDVEQTDESMRRIGGGLDEINSILSATQKKINRFKTVCGSLGTLLKVRVGSKNNTPDHKPLATTEIPDGNEKGIENIETTDETLTIETSSSIQSGSNDDTNYNSSTTNAKKIDLNEKVGSHLDKLDSLITKAENAQYSMQHQTKQMKKIIKK